MWWRGRKSWWENRTTADCRRQTAEITAASGILLMALAHAVTITLFILALFYKWFAVDNRYVVFLYNHLNATPFDEITSSRYWMSGLVVSGAVMVLYIAANWLLGRIVANYRAPAWQCVWL
jgi:hypothetical protein